MFGDRFSDRTNPSMAEARTESWTGKRIVVSPVEGSDYTSMSQVWSEPPILFFNLYEQHCPLSCVIALDILLKSVFLVLSYEMVRFCTLKVIRSCFATLNY